MSVAVVAITFGVIFLAELPDKSMIASLVLGTRYRSLHVWLGAAAAFAVHVVIAVTAGGLLSLLPHRLVQSIVAALFLVGAAILIFGREAFGRRRCDEPVRHRRRAADNAAGGVAEFRRHLSRRVG